jgi:TPR repeat protein
LNDKQKGLEYWKLAEDFGSSEAAVRIAVAKVFGSLATNDLTQEFLLFEKSEQNGSVLAQFALGYCYENGLGVKKNLPTAVDYYRKSAQRGNQFAYEQLRRLYDNLRPPEKTFKVN